MRPGSGDGGHRIRIVGAVRRRALLSVLVAVLVSLPLGPAPHATAVGLPGPGPIGGQLLGQRGTVLRSGPGTPPLPTGLSASGWLVADLDTGDVLAARDAHGRFAPASTLKALTALTLIPRLDPQGIVTATDADVDVDGSKVGVVPGQRYRIQQLFTALLVVSGNDAANVLAEAAGGGGRTVALMNEEAARLGAMDTKAATVTGLDAPGQVTSAYDLALVGRAGMRLPAFRQYVAVQRAFMPGPRGSFEIGNHNRLLRNYPGAIGIKNGYTVAAGATFIGAARRGGRTLVVTLLRASPRVWREAAALLDWGFAARDRVTPVGRLVDPPVLTPAAAQARVAGRPAAAGQSPYGGSRQSGDLPRQLVMVVAILAGVTVLLGRRRRQPQVRQERSAPPRVRRRSSSAAAAASADRATAPRTSGPR